MEPELSFLSDGSLAPGPRAVFSQLPHSPLLTLHMDVPHAWLVAAVHSPHDLDNIHLQSVENGVQAEFLLEHILVEGAVYILTFNTVYMCVHMYVPAHLEQLSRANLNCTSSVPRADLKCMRTEPAPN